jgi:hypothetical protein
VFRATNAFAAAIESEFPHVTMNFLAYSYCTQPVKTKARDNVAVQIAFNTDGAVPITDPINSNSSKLIAGWNAVSNRIHMWGYQANFCNAIMPNPRWGTVSPNLKYYYAHGIRGVSDEMSEGIAPDETNGRMIGSGLDRLMVYIIGRTLWDVTLDGEELIDEYCEYVRIPPPPASCLLPPASCLLPPASCLCCVGWLSSMPFALQSLQHNYPLKSRALSLQFGPVGGPLIRAYIDLVRGATAPGKSSCFIGCTNVTAPFLTPPVVLEAGRIFAQATAALVRPLPASRPHCQ